MLKSRAIVLILFVVCAAAFGYGLIALFNLRFAAGDVYPEYSSLRSDPVGAKVLYESLHQVGLHDVRRNYSSVDKLPDGKDTTLFIFGLPWHELDADPAEFKKLDGFVRNGGRLVVTLFPKGVSGATNNPLFKTRVKNAAAQPMIELGDKWGFKLHFVPLPRGPNFTTKPVVATPVAPEMQPEHVSWHSAVVFTNLDSAWRVIYARDTNAVLIERRIGAGTVVIATDSFFVSNEAMRDDREPKLLAWLTGPNREIIFNETHLGVMENPGIAALARKYNLHGAVVALLALAGLFVWKNSVSFVPMTGGAEREHIAGHESAAGFTNLLRRSVPPKELLQTCLDEWHKSLKQDGRCTPPRLEKIGRAVARHNAAKVTNAVSTYNEIANVLERKK